MDPSLIETVVLAWGGKEIAVKLLGPAAALARRGRVGCPGADADDRQAMARRRRTKAGQLISAQPGADDE